VQRCPVGIAIDREQHRHSAHPLASHDAGYLVWSGCMNSVIYQRCCEKHHSLVRDAK
jgi:hypothetical protein